MTHSRYVTLLAVTTRDRLQRSTLMARNLPEKTLADRLLRRKRE